jgi:hypothetical protein
VRPLEGVPAEGPVRIFLDDERPAPEGWTLAKYANELFRIVDRIPERVEAISFDQNLIPGDAKGREIADLLWEEVASGEIVLPNLKQVGFHTDDHSAADAMQADLRIRMAAQTTFPQVEIVMGMPRIAPPATVMQGVDRLHRERIAVETTIVDAAGADGQRMKDALSSRGAKGPGDAIVTMPDRDRGR